MFLGNFVEGDLYYSKDIQRLLTSEDEYLFVVLNTSNKKIRD